MSLIEIPQKIVIAGIDTEIGKTITSAIICEAWQADYWKPIQAGDLHYSDSDKIKNLISNSKTQIHAEGIQLKHPMSPHASADLENIEVSLDDFNLPNTNNRLIIELAGGLMVPINHQQLNIDLIAQWKLPVILVSKYYLGSINHTLLSWHILKDYNIPFLGFIFNGKKNKSTFDIILEYTNANPLLEIEEEQEITKEIIQKYAHKFMNDE